MIEEEELKAIGERYVNSLLSKYNIKATIHFMFDRRVAFVLEGEDTIYFNIAILDWINEWGERTVYGKIGLITYKTILAHEARHIMQLHGVVSPLLLENDADEYASRVTGISKVCRNVLIHAFICYIRYYIDANKDAFREFKRYIVIYKKGCPSLMLRLNSFIGGIVRDIYEVVKAKK